MAEESLTTEVQVLSSDGVPAHGTARLELHGKVLLVQDVRKNRLITRCLSTVGTTRELHPYLRYHLLKYGLGAFALFLMIGGPVSARFGVEVGSTVLLGLLEFVVVAAGLWYLLPCFSTPAITYRFNTEECVFDLTVKDGRAKSPAHTALAEHFLPFEQEYHHYAFAESVCFLSLRVHSVPFIQEAESLIRYLMVPLSFVLTVKTGLDFREHSLTFAILNYCFAPIVALTMYHLARISPVASEPKPIPHELRTIRSALNLLARGDTAAAVKLLHAFLEAAPEASHTRKLLAQICIGLARYDDALGLFQTPPVAGMQEWAFKIKHIKRMTAGTA